MTIGTYYTLLDYFKTFFVCLTSSHRYVAVHTALLQYSRVGQLAFLVRQTAFFQKRFSIEIKCVYMPMNIRFFHYDTINHLLNMLVFVMISYSHVSTSSITEYSLASLDVEGALVLHHLELRFLPNIHHDYNIQFK